MAFAAAAVERAMTYQRVIMRARAGSLTWLQAADILNIYPRSLRRWWARYEQDPKLGLLDRRRRRPAQDAVTKRQGLSAASDIRRREDAVVLLERPGCPVRQDLGLGGIGVELRQHVAPER
jgi:hypothetical protein